MSNKSLINARVQKTKKLAKLLQFVPFVECVILNGSLAEAKSKPSSDIDILIVAKMGRIFTARFFVTCITAVLGLKRSSNENKNHAGKFCFNYYLTSDFLEVPHDRGEEINAYCAKNYSGSILAWGDKQIFQEYFYVNYPWMEKYLKMSKSKFRMTNEMSNIKSFPVIENKVSKQFPVGNIKGRKVGKWWEERLRGKFGDWFELQAKKVQIFLIERDKRTCKYPNYIVYNDRELRFHPPKK